MPTPEDKPTPEQRQTLWQWFRNLFRRRKHRKPTQHKANTKAGQTRNKRTDSRDRELWIDDASEVAESATYSTLNRGSRGSGSGSDWPSGGGSGNGLGSGGGGSRGSGFFDGLFD